MNYLKIEQEMADKGLVLLYGEEKLLMEEIVQTFIKRWTLEAFRDFNVLSLPGEAKEESVIDASLTLPLMDRHKFIQVKDVARFIENNPLSPDFLEGIKNLAEGVVLVFCEGEKALDKRTKFYKWIKKHGACIHCQPLKQGEVMDYLKRMSGDIQVPNQVYAYFIDVMGYLKKEVSLLELRLEWEKFLAVAQTQGLDRASIDYFLSYRKQINIFAFTDGFSERNIKKTFQALEALYDQGMDIYQVISMLNRQVEQMVRARILLDQGYNEGALKERMKVHPFVAKKLVQNRGRYGLKELKDMLEDLIDLDQNLKTSSLDPKILLETRLLALMTGRSQ